MNYFAWTGVSHDVLGSLLDWNVEPAEIIAANHSLRPCMPSNRFPCLIIIQRLLADAHKIIASVIPHRANTCIYFCRRVFYSRILLQLLTHNLQPENHITLYNKALQIPSILVRHTMQDICCAQHKTIQYMERDWWRCSKALLRKLATGLT